MINQPAARGLLWRSELIHKNDPIFLGRFVYYWRELKSYIKFIAMTSMLRRMHPIVRRIIHALMGLAAIHFLL